MRVDSEPSICYLYPLLLRQLILSIFRNRTMNCYLSQWNRPDSDLFPVRNGVKDSKDPGKERFDLRNAFVLTESAN